MNILITEDDPTTALILQRVLQNSGYEVTHAIDGEEALKYVKTTDFDALVTDWMMPNMDGIELIRSIRKLGPEKNSLIIIVITALVSPEAKLHAVDAGADDYLSKPFKPSQVLTTLRACFSRRDQPVPPLNDSQLLPGTVSPPFVCVAMAASTGGPEAITKVVRQLPVTEKAAFFVLLHGPDWMIKSYAEQLKVETKMEVTIAENDEPVNPGVIYIAPGGRHLKIEPRTFRIRLKDTPAENFVKPSADPLFVSIAQAFGAFSIVAVLSGLGRDGALGAAHIIDAGGIVIAQDPATTVNSSMAETIINLGFADQVVPINAIASEISSLIESLNDSLESQAKVIANS